MIVQSIKEGLAWCEVDGQRRQVSTLLLIEPPEVGQHVLVHGDNAIRLLEAKEAGLIRDALAAVLAASDGQPFEHLIADLIEREPELPAHLTAPQPA